MVSASGERAGLEDADQVLARTRQEVRDLAARLASGETDDRAPRGVGTAAGEKIKVVAVNGRIERVELDPSVMRMPSQTLAEEFTRAANAAIDALRKAYADAMPTIDLDALATDMEQVEELGLHALRRAAEGVDEAVAQYRRLEQL